MSSPAPSLLIEELDSIRFDAIPDHVFASTEPIILRGLVSDWPLVRLGNQSSIKLIEQLKSYYTGQAAPVYFGDDSSNRRLAYNKDVSALNFDLRKTNLADVLDELANQIDTSTPNLPVRYIASNIIDYYFTGLRADNDISFDAEYFQRHPLEGGDPMVHLDW